VSSQSTLAMLTQLRISADVQWANGRRPALASGINGVSFEEQVEAGLRTGLFGEPLPQQLGMLVSMVDTSDPLAELDGLKLSYATYEPVARLLITERLSAVGGAALVKVAVGPVRAGRRSISVAWQDGKAYTNVEPDPHEIAGERSA
jgi:hypothetical protein